MHNIAVFFFIFTNNIANIFLFRIWTTFVQNCINAKWYNLSLYLWKKRYRILISKFIWFISKYCELFTFSWAGPRSDSISKRISTQRLFWLQLWSWNKWLVNLWKYTYQIWKGNFEAQWNKEKVDKGSTSVSNHHVLKYALTG